MTPPLAETGEEGSKRKRGVGGTRGAGPGQRTGERGGETAASERKQSDPLGGATRKELEALGRSRDGRETLGKQKVTDKSHSPVNETCAGAS